MTQFGPQPAWGPFEVLNLSKQRLSSLLKLGFSALDPFGFPDGILQVAPLLILQESAGSAPLPNSLGAEPDEPSKHPLNRTAWNNTTPSPDHVQRRREKERIVEVPQKEVREIVKQVPKPVVQYVDKSPGWTMVFGEAGWVSDPKVWRRGSYRERLRG